MTEPTPITIKNVRVLTTVLVTLFLLFFILSNFAVIFWSFFCAGLFPASVLTLGIHFFIGRHRRRKRLPMNEWDNIKIFLAIGGAILGLILWAALYLILN